MNDDRPPASAGVTKDGRTQKAETPDEATATASLPRLRSSDLLAGGREALIDHGGEQYRLRLTSNGKLILTK